MPSIRNGWTFGVLLCLPAPTSASLASLGGTATAIAQAQGQQNIDLPITLPGPGSATATAPPSSQSTVGYSVTDSPVGTRLTHTFDFLASDLPHAISWATGVATFAPSVDSSYALSGQLLATVGNGLFAGMDMEMHLWTASTVHLFDFVANGRPAYPGNQIVLGQGGSVSGSLNGILSAGVTYQLIYTYKLINFDAGGGPPAAAGDLTIELTPVPSPGVAAVLALGLPMAASRRRRLPVSRATLRSL